MPILTRGQWQPQSGVPEEMACIESSSFDQTARRVGYPDTVPLVSSLELKRLAVKEKGNLSFACHDAFGYYIQYAVNPAVKLNDVAFHQKMVNQVVVPLLNELDNWRGRTFLD
jgi:hypothetical protein